MNHKKNTDFVVYGTFSSEGVSILKHELEGGGIPVKVLYPGTGADKSLTAEAYFPALQLMIMASDFKLADKIREKLNIEPIRTGQEMPLPKTYSLAKKGLNRFFLLGCLISFLGIYVSGYFSYNPLSQKLLTLYSAPQFYFAVAFFVFFLLWIFSVVYNIFKK